MNFELIIARSDSEIYLPLIEDGATWETERKGQPGKMTFKVVPDAALNFVEGNPVRLRVDEHNIFYGFVFQKKRSKDGIISVTAYDQLRYFKNKDTYVYANKKASQLVTMLADDFNLQTGAIEDTRFIIDSRIEDNKTLFDIVQNALDLTLQSTGRMYVLYDDFGRLALRDIESMKIDLFIDDETAQDFDYTSSIDGETYNKIKLAYENEETGKRDIYIAQDSGHMNDWGILQYFETIDESVNGKAKADALLSLYNQKTRSLTVKKAFGDPRVRAGSSLPVYLNLGDIVVKNYMVVEKVKHTFEENLHTMDLTLRGGTVVA